MLVAAVEAAGLLSRLPLQRSMGGNDWYNIVELVKHSVRKKVNANLAGRGTGGADRLRAAKADSPSREWTTASATSSTEGKVWSPAFTPRNGRRV